MKKLVGLAVLALLWGLFTPAGLAQAEEAFTPYWTPPAYPTEVYFDIVILDITSFNEREETFTFEGSLVLLWADERLAFDPAEVGADYKAYHDTEATKQLTTAMWSPVLEFENIRGQRRISNASLLIASDGSVTYEDHFVVTLATDLELLEFPFDTQKLQINVASFFYMAEEMVLAPDSKVSFRPGFTMNEWQVEGEPTTAISERGAYGLEVPADQEGGKFSFGQFTITVVRNAGFYVWKLMVPLFIITSISWASFWRKPSVAPRVNTTFSCMLTVVAYNFVVANSLPRISYLTKLDTIFILTYAFIALAVFVNVAASYLDDNGRGAAGLRLDKMARWLFPVAYVVLYALLLFI